MKRQVAIFSTLGAILCTLQLANLGAAEERDCLGDQILELRERKVDGDDRSPLRSRPGELAEAVKELAKDPQRKSFDMPHPPVLGPRDGAHPAIHPPATGWNDFEYPPPPRGLSQPSFSTRGPASPRFQPHPPGALKPASPCSLLLETAFQIESLAYRLDMKELYDQADSLRKAAVGLRKEARRRGPSPGDPGPVPAGP